MNKKLIRITILFLIVAICIVGLSRYWIYNGLPWDKYSFSKKVNRYLSGKYSETMIVNDINYSFKNSTINHPFYYAIVYPKSNKSLMFRVTENETSNMDDNLVNVVWEKYVFNRVNIFLSEIYEGIEYKIKITIPRVEIDYPTINDIPKYENVGGKLLKEEKAIIDIVIFSSGDNKDIEKLYMIVEIIRENKLWFNELSIRFTDDNFKKIKLVRLKWDEANQLNKKEDLIQYFK